jgi:SpoVK/Ycf46/Vps4 family AAA+-type ATPase
LDALTVRDPPPEGGVTLVAPPTLHAGLAHLRDRCRLRDGLSDGLGPAARSRHCLGVRALFHGPSGTGKTLAAHWLAAELGMPLHRVDLAALTSKWIGETEKNLSDLLSAAEHADVVLLFDEADALFGARTEVSDAHDRYANAQTNYLLQRMDCFTGIAVMTSNGRDRFDAAFTRRLDAILEFPLPDPPARRALWQAHLGDAGEGHKMDAATLDRLALVFDLAGGHIRNIVLGAAVTARAEERGIRWNDVMAAAAAEYAKLGRPMPSGAARG